MLQVNVTSYNNKTLINFAFMHLQFPVCPHIYLYLSTPPPTKSFPPPFYYFFPPLPGLPVMWFLCADWAHLAGGCASRSPRCQSQKAAPRAPADGYMHSATQAGSFWLWAMQHATCVCARVRASMRPLQIKCLKTNVCRSSPSWFLQKNNFVRLASWSLPLTSPLFLLSLPPSYNHPLSSLPQSVPDIFPIILQYQEVKPYWGQTDI